MGILTFLDKTLFTTILVLATSYIISYVVNKLWYTREGMDNEIKNYQDYSGDDIKVLVYKNAGNIAALKDAVDGLVQTSTDVQGRVSTLEKEYETINNVLQATKATADETKANVEGAVTEYKAQGDQQAAALNDVTFEEEPN